MFIFAPKVIIVMGLPGSGKSYFASRFTPKLKGVYLSSDLIRKELFPHPTYSTEEKEAVYNEMEDRMGKALEVGKTVVLDATFYTKSLRQRFATVARKASSEVKFIQITADEELTKTRVSVARDHSDADWKVYLKLRDLFEAPGVNVLRLSSDDENIDGMIEEAIEYVGI